MSYPAGSSTTAPSAQQTRTGAHHKSQVCACGLLWQRLFADHVIDGKRVAYFRGRKLHGKALKVPEGYRGVVIEKTDPPKPQAPRPDEPEVVDLDAEEEMPLGALEAKAEFDEVVIWGHESVADASSDPYARGFEEWIAVAEQVRVVCDIQSLNMY